MSKVISIVSIKGGTGKTTTAVNLGAALIKEGKKVLLIDADGHANLTKSCGKVPVEQRVTIANLMAQAVDDPEMLDAGLQRAIISLDEGMDLIPANHKLSNFLTRLVVMKTSQPMYGDQSERCEFVLKRVVDAVKNRYDYVIIDSGSTRDELVINVLTAADEVIVPVQAVYLDADGLPDTFEMIRVVQKNCNPNLTVGGVLLTMYHKRTNLAKAVREDVTEMYGQEVHVFEQPIDYSIRVAEQPMVGESIFKYEPTNPAAGGYASMAEEVISRG